MVPSKFWCSGTSNALDTSNFWTIHIHDPLHAAFTDCRSFRLAAHRPYRALHVVLPRGTSLSTKTRTKETCSFRLQPVYLVTLACEAYVCWASRGDCGEGWRWTSRSGPLSVRQFEGCYNVTIDELYLDWTCRAVIGKSLKGRAQTEQIDVTTLKTELCAELHSGFWP